MPPPLENFETSSIQIGLSVQCFRSYYFVPIKCVFIVLASKPKKRSSQPQVLFKKRVFLLRLGWADYQSVSKLKSSLKMNSSSLTFSRNLSLFSSYACLTYFRKSMLISNGVVRSIESRWVKCWWKCEIIQVYSKPCFWFYRLH